MSVLSPIYEAATNTPSPKFSFRRCWDETLKSDVITIFWRAMSELAVGASLTFLAPPFTYSFIVAFNLSLLITVVGIVAAIAIARLVVHVAQAVRGYTRRRSMSGSDDSDSVTFG